MIEPTVRFPTCHDVIWTATEQELEQIREYMLVLKGGLDKKIEPSRDAPPLPYTPYKHVCQLF